ncbi:MAG TPA: fused MFS/spermidine synthase [Pirellulales bacterium]
MLRFALAIFLSAFLLFLVQPLIGKAILPWFGGTPAVWTTCLLFFQTALLLGYAYSHFLVDHTTPKTQVIVHAIVLAASLIWLPLAVSTAWAPTGEESPTWQVMGLLTASLLGPYVALSATAPLLQSWFSHTQPGKSPYWLYALSNCGSLLALVAFPFLFERAFGTREQMLLWSGLYAAFLILCGICAASVFRLGTRSTAPSPALAGAGDLKSHSDANSGLLDAPTRAPATTDSRSTAGSTTTAAVDASPSAAKGWTTPSGEPTLGAQVLWIVLPLVTAMLLSAGTNQLCQDVTVVPFLWIAPLALYLLTFILVFNFDHLYVRRWFFIFLVSAELAATFVLFLDGGASFDLTVGSYNAVIFMGCLVCHAEMVKLKPAPRRLTQFYLFMSLGGALGGAFVALAAPALFPGYWEFPLALAGCYLLPVICACGDPQSTIYNGRPRALLFIIGLGLVFFALVWGARIYLSLYDPAVKDVRRGFFGVKIVRESKPTDQYADGTPVLPQVRLLHGSTIHGSQFKDPAIKNLPNAYFSPVSGVGLAMRLHPKRQSPDPAARRLNVGIVGLGAGTIAALAQPGDKVRYYEIDPQVTELAKKYFTYLQDCPALQDGGSLDVIHGDARISIAREVKDASLPRYDVLVSDAFSSDSVPLHLLTKEAFEVYRERLAPDGILCMHVSNRYLELTQVVRGAAEAIGFTPVSLQTSADEKHLREAANWVIVTNNKEFLARPELNDADSKEVRRVPWGEAKILWTDDRSNLFDVLMFPEAGSHGRAGGR